MVPAATTPANRLLPVVAAVLVAHGAPLSSVRAQRSAGPVDLSPGFPRTMFFRHERELSRMSRAEAVDAIARFDALSIKLFNEAPRQRYRDLIPIIAGVKRRKPGMPALVHLDHFAAVRPLEGTRLSPGADVRPVRA